MDAHTIIAMLFTQGDFPANTPMSGSNALLSSSLAHTPRHDRNGHIVQLYTDAAFLVDVLSRFIGDALAGGDVAVVVATASHRSELERRLSERGMDTAKAPLQGRYFVLDASETLARFMVNGSVDESRFKEVIGGVLMQAGRVRGDKGRGIAVFGELVALLWADGKPQEAIRVEQLWNELAKSHSFSLLCGYPITGFSDELHIEPFLRMCGQHSGVMPSESYLGLSSEEDRMRSIAQLQQKAQVLEKELAFRESEARFRLLVEAVQDYAIFMLDPDGRVASWNIGAERIKGYKADEIVGKHFSCFYPEEDKRNGKPQWELIIAAKEGRFEDEGWRLRKDGSRFWANVIITVLKDESGQVVGFGKVTRDFTERMNSQKSLEAEVAQRREAERLLHDSEKSLRRLSLHLLRTQDEERRRIGRDLHDSLGQYLAVLKMKLDSLRSQRPSQEDETAREIEQCCRLVVDSIKEVRTISYLLYPPMLEEMGLKSAIPWYLDGFSDRSGIKTSFEVKTDFGRFSRETELALFRVLQESLTNVHRHSGSQTAHIRLSMDGEVAVLEIEDKGRGVSDEVLEESGAEWSSAPGVGVRGMKERMRQLGGKLELISTKIGTTVRATIPVGKPAAS